MADGPAPRSGRTAKGRAAEAAVASWLSGRGWSILARNYRRGPGELDIVALRGQELAFVEVKSVDAFGLAGLESSVGPNKRRRIVETSKLFLVSHRELSSAFIRYDVAAVRAGAVVEYYEGAFSERA